VTVGRTAGESPVRRVLYVAKTHLDVGFTASAASVRQRYLDDFFPRAVGVAEQLRALGGPARLRWTTGSWILSEALDAADREHRLRLEAAIEQGDLCWHALPFTMHTEYADPSLVRHGLSLSAELDRRFGRRTRAAKATDVPGHTRGLVPLLAEAGVDLLHVGVNPVAAAPSVPLQFRWRDDVARPPGGPTPEVSVMYQPGGYGDVQVVVGTDVAVAVDLTGDNLGPRSVDEVVGAFADLAARFPGAEIVAATLDDVAAVMADAHDALPVVTAEIGDSWIHGVGSDPQKTAGFRALSRLRRDWLDSGRVDAADPGLRRASTRLLLVAEHTWGMDQKTHWPDTEHWSSDQLAQVRSDPATVLFESSWAEQRHLLQEFVDEVGAAGHASLAQEAADVLADAMDPPRRAPVDRWASVTPGDLVELGSWRLSIDPTGAVVHCAGPDGRDWASPDAPLFQVHQQTFDAQDYERWYATYNRSVTPPDEWWARWDNTKPGLERTAARSTTWPTTLVGAHVGQDDTGPMVVVDQRIAAAAADPVAVPERYRTVLRWDEHAGAVVAELCWWARPAARWPGVTWWRVAPVVSDPSGWTMVKLGTSVSPFDVVDGGGRSLHVAERLEHPDGVGIGLVDTGLVSPGAPRLLVWDGAPVDLSAGWHVCVLANLWGTNFPMWNQGDGRDRVELRLPS
jgi:hypothetical protein